MASLFGFRTRNPSRDRETDRARFLRLTTLMDEIASHIRTERKGLEKRYREASADAGFLIAAMENDCASSRSSSRLDELTKDVLRCERRLAALSRHIELMEELRKGAEGLLDETSPGEDERGPAGKAPAEPSA